jgi:C_GCAxxG_C_C family probable redox protein
MGVKCDCFPRIAAGLGGGLARHGEACGALTGGVLAIGLIYGADGPETSEAKDALYAKAGQFVRRFAEANGALRCRDLLGVDLNSDAGQGEFDARNLGDLRCVPSVRNATQALLELLDEWGDAAG